jgi:large subunit ribosomal protein L21
MYAIIDTGGKQYKVSEGQIFDVEQLEGEVGSDIVLDQVLLVKDDGGVKVGQPFLDARVTCEVVEHGKGDKVVVFKHKKRKDYRKKAGHRQTYTKVRVKSIEA